MKKYLLLIVSLLLTSVIVAQETAEAGPEKVIRELYDLVTIEKGTTGDWDSVRAMFVKEAVIVLRTSRTGTSVFTLEGFVKDFQDFIENYKIKETGFNETILNMKTWVYGDMAHSLVLYEAEIPNSEIPPNKGIDSFLLIRKNGVWKVVAITNEVPTPERPVPEELLK
jgi:hypothetical protein